MIGTKWPSEKHTFLDPVSGQPVTQLTDQYLNFHLYFTDNSFDPSCENIYFQSNRCNPESERCQLFRMNLESGEMEQLTDDPAGHPTSGSLIRTGPSTEKSTCPSTAIIITRTPTSPSSSEMP